MEFEFDPEKSAANRLKHGIDFEAAQAIWLDERLIVAPARVEGEPRFIAVGRIGDRCWSAIFTERGGRIRIISVRRSRHKEVEAYEGE
jgi:uncharacterized protein